MDYSWKFVQTFNDAYENSIFIPIKKDVSPKLLFKHFLFHSSCNYGDVNIYSSWSSIIHGYRNIRTCKVHVLRYIKNYEPSHTLKIMSRRIRKATICRCETKGADQLQGDGEADQHLCFCYMDSTISLLPKSEILSLSPASVTVQAGMCRTWLVTQIVDFLMGRFRCKL